MQRRKRIFGILITALMIAVVFLIWGGPSWAPSKSGQSSTSTPRQMTSASASKIVNRSTIRASTSSESSVTSPQAASSLNESSFFSPTLNRSWRYFTYLPAGYTSSRQYPLILMLHGMDGDATNLVKLVDSKTMLDQAVTATKHPAVVVFIDGGNSFYVDSPAEKMQTAIVQDLLPHLQQQVAILPQADAHAVGGMSMGGYGALHLALAVPTAFRTVAALSPAVWQQVPEAARPRMPAFLRAGQWNQAQWEAEAPAKMLTGDRTAGLHVFLASGQADTTVSFQDVSQFSDQLTAAGVNPTTHWSAAGAHGFTYWQQILPEAYQWLLRQLPVPKKISE